MPTPSERLRDLGVELPPPPGAVAAYIPARRDGPLVWTSGQLPFVDGSIPTPGKLGTDIGVEAGQEAARRSALNAIAVAAAAVGGVDNLESVVKVVGFVQSAPDFYDQPKVVNGASELLQAVFGDDGRHARSAVGVSALPLNAPVEVEVVFRIRG
jgi:enamine deaminase RidA (YjgF/YER057c/UK114 family)